MSDEIKHDVARDADDPKNRISGMYISAHRLPYVSPTPGELPLIAIGVNSMVKTQDDIKAPGIHIYTRPFLEKVKDLGFNAVQDEMSGKQMDRDSYGMGNFVAPSISACAEAGIRQIVRLTDLSHYVLDCSSSENPKVEIENHLFQMKEENSEMKNDDSVKRAEASIDMVMDWNYSMGIEVEISTSNGVSHKLPVWECESNGGYQMGDEPKMRMFPWFAKIKDRILEVDKWKRTAFTDLFSCHGMANGHGKGVGDFCGCMQRRYVRSDRPEELGTLPPYDATRPDEAYSIILNEYNAILRPALWCFNGYLLDGTPNISNLKYQKEYFNDLDTIRRNSLMTDRPFWITVRGLYRNGNGSENSGYAIPWDYAELLGRVMNVEAKCGLAYGAKGLMFWTIMARPHDNYEWAPLRYDLDLKEGEQSGKVQGEAVETELYEATRNMVGDVKRFEKLFLCSRAMETGHIEPEGRFSIKEPQNTARIGFIDKIETEGSFCLARHETPLGEFIVVINTDPIASHRFTAESSSSFCELTDGNISIVRGGQKTVPGLEWSESSISGAINIYEPEPDPYPGSSHGSKVSFHTEMEPGSWRIFYRERKKY